MDIHRSSNGHRRAACFTPFSCRNLRDEPDDNDFEDWNRHRAWTDFDEEAPFDPEPTEGNVDNDFDFDDEPEETDPPDDLWNEGDWD